MNRFFACVVTGLPVVFASSASGQANLIAHYTFDVDGTATVGTDAIMGTAATVVTDAMVGGGSLYLSGAPSTDTFGDDGAVSGNSFDWSTSDTRSVAFWMKATAGDHGDSFSTMISLGAGAGAGNRFDIRTDGDVLRLEVQSGGTTTGSVVADGLWHHITVVVIDPGTVATAEYYIDGISQGVFGGSATALDTGNGPLRVGDSYHDLSRDFKGNLDDVRLYDTALTAAEVAALVATEPGFGYCPGDGTGSPCPCGNNSAGPGGCDWGDVSFPEGGVLTASGSDSIAVNDTMLTATGIANNFGIFFGANNQVNGGSGNPLNDGLRCAGGGLVRLIPPTMASGNQATIPMPVPTLDPAAAPGVTRRYQYWFRTPTGPCGQQANLTNGYEIQWGN